MTAAIPSSHIHIDLGDQSYDVHFEALTELPRRLSGAGLPPGDCVLVTDEQVGPLHADSLAELLERESWRPVVVTLPAGEATKSIEHLCKIFDTTLARGLDRDTPVLAVGGGVVGDLAGFAAATLLRGLPLVQVPTTLVAQVDSAIGGKTGINHAAGKNLIGAFHQPRLVFADPAVLRTLPQREWTSGLAEVVKHALIADAPFFDILEDRWDAVVAGDPAVVAMLVARAAAVKARVVEQDVRESGLRAILNFGHTFGHAIERVAGYGTFTHGEAVAAGMRAALHLSHHLHRDFDPARADRLVARLPIPPGMEALDVDALIDAMQSDKKVRSGRLRFVLLDRIGHAYVTDRPERSEVEAALAHIQTEAASTR